jgi:hypothetical protein
VHAPHQTAVAHVLSSRIAVNLAGGTGRLIGLAVSLLQPVESRPALFSLPLRDRNRRRIVLVRALGLRSQAAVLTRATVQRTAASNHPGSSAGLNSPGGCMCRRTGQARRLSWGFSPFSVFRRRCAIRTIARSGRSRFDVPRKLEAAPA